jgi:hypothetical protein
MLKTFPIFICGICGEKHYSTPAFSIDTFYYKGYFQTLACDKCQDQDFLFYTKNPMDAKAFEERLKEKKSKKLKGVSV